MEERGSGVVVQDFQTGESDPAKQVISGQVRGDENVPGWVVSIEVSEDKSVREFGRMSGEKVLVQESEGVLLMKGE